VFLIIIRRTRAPRRIVHTLRPIGTTFASLRRVYDSIERSVFEGLDLTAARTNGITAAFLFRRTNVPVVGFTRDDSFYAFRRPLNGRGNALGGKWWWWRRRRMNDVIYGPEWIGLKDPRVAVSGVRLPNPVGRTTKSARWKTRIITYVPSTTLYIIYAASRQIYYSENPIPAVRK